MSNRSLTAKTVPNFADRGCRVGSAADTYDRIRVILASNKYFYGDSIKGDVKGK
jgi:hypothetical protein